MRDRSQKQEIINKIKQSLEELKVKFADNKHITAILSSEDTIRIEEKEGIVMTVVAIDAGAIYSIMHESLLQE